MAFMNENRGKPVFNAVGGTGSTLSSTQAQTNLQQGTSPTTTNLQGVFNEAMEEQKKLYADITRLNTDKNRQSSYLSLAKSVSEKA